MDGGMTGNIPTANVPLQSGFIAPDFTVPTPQIPNIPEVPVNINIDPSIEQPLALGSAVMQSIPTSYVPLDNSQITDISGFNMPKEKETSFNKETVVYNYYASQRKNDSPEVDAIMDKIRTGYEPTTDEILRITSTQADYESYRKTYEVIEPVKIRLDEITERTKDGRVTMEDLNYLIDSIGFDPQTASMMRLGFINAGRVVSGYEEGAMTMSGVTMEDVNNLIKSAGLDPASADQIRQQIINNGRIVDSYETGFQMKI